MMFRRLMTIGSLVIYVAAMLVSLTAHDPFHRHHSEHSSDQVETHSHGHHAAGHHSHCGVSHHHHKSHGDHCASGKSHSPDNTKQENSTGHDHEHDCPVCEFLMLKCLEISIAEVESASELIELAQAAAVNHHTAFSPYKPPSRAPPVC